MTYRSEIEIAIKASVGETVQLNQALAQTDGELKKVAGAIDALNNAIGPRYVGNANQAIATTTNMGKAFQELATNESFAAATTEQVKAGIVEIAGILQASAAGVQVTSASWERINTIMAQVNASFGAIPATMGTVLGVLNQLSAQASASATGVDVLSAAFTSVAGGAVTYQQALTIAANATRELASQASGPLQGALLAIATETEAAAQGAALFGSASVTTGATIADLTTRIAQLASTVGGPIQAELIRLSNLLKLNQEVVQKGASAVPVMGQAMVASFSMASVAAGNFQQAIFGLGFSFMFLGEQMANPRFLKALAAFSAIQVVIGQFGPIMNALGMGASKAADSFDELSAASSSYNKVIDEIRGATALAGDSLLKAAKDGQQFGITLKQIQETKLQEMLLSSAKDMDTFKQTLNDTGQELAGFFQFFASGLEQMETKKTIGEALAAGADINEIVEMFEKTGDAAGAAFAKALAGQIEGEATAAATAAASQLMAAVEGHFRDIKINVEIETIQNRSDEIVESLNVAKEAMKEAHAEDIAGVKDYYDNLNDIAREGHQDWVTGFQRAAQEHTTALQRALEDELALMQEAANAQIETIRDGLAEQKALNDAYYDDLITKVETALEAQLAAYETAFELFKTAQEKALRQSLDDIRDYWEEVKEVEAQAWDDKIQAEKDAEQTREDNLQANLDKEFDTRKEALDAQIEARKEALDDELDAIREGLRAQQDAIRDSAKAAADAVRAGLKEQEDAIKEQYENQTDAIKDALKDQQDAIKDALDLQIETYKDAGDARIEAVKDAADAELEANAERIKLLKDQEKELEKELSDIAKTRKDLMSESAKLAGELAGLQDLARRTGGGDPALQREIAARQGALAAIQAQGAALQDQAAIVQDNIDATEEAIKVEEDKADAIKDARDEAIKAIKDQVDDQIKEARRAADAEIELAKEAADAKIKEINKARDAQIAAAKAAADAQIDAINDAADAQIEAAKKASDAQIEAAQKAAQGDIDAWKAAYEADKAKAQEIIDAIKAFWQAQSDERIKNLNDQKDTALDNIEDEKQAAIWAEEDKTKALIEEEKKRVEQLKTDAKTIADNNIAEYERQKEEANKKATEAAEFQIKEIQRALAQNTIDKQRALADDLTDYRNWVTDTITEKGRQLQKDLDNNIAARDDRISKMKEAFDDSMLKMDDLIKKEQDRAKEIIEGKRKYEEQATFIKNVLLPLIVMMADKFGVSDAGLRIFTLALQNAKSEEEMTRLLKGFFAGKVEGYAEGGIIGGMPGEPRLILAHGGEQVLTRDQQLLSAGTPVSIVIQNVNMNSPADVALLERTINRSLGKRTNLSSRMGLRTRRF